MNNSEIPRENWLNSEMKIPNYTKRKKCGRVNPIQSEIFFVVKLRKTRKSAVSTITTFQKHSWIQHIVHIQIQNFAKKVYHCSSSSSAIAKISLLLNIEHFDLLQGQDRSFPG